MGVALEFGLELVKLLCGEDKANISRSIKYLESEDIIDILKSEDRTRAGKTANPEGLYLKNVFY